MPMKYLFPEQKAEGKTQKSGPVHEALFFDDKFDDGIERGGRPRRRLLSTRELAA